MSQRASVVEFEAHHVDIVLAELLVEIRTILVIKIQQTPRPGLSCE
jgi:hypothetical protein